MSHGGVFHPCDILPGYELKVTHTEYNFDHLDEICYFAAYVKNTNKTTNRDQETRAI